MKRFIAFLLIAVMMLASTGCINKVVGLITGYFVIFDLNGGELVSGEARQNVRPGQDAEAPSVKRDGYEFGGWDKEFTAVQENLTVTAKWTKLWTVRFDPGDGSIANGDAILTIAEGTTPKTPEVEREGWSFIGWDPKVSSASADVTYTAQWERIVYSSTEVSERIAPAVIEITTYDYYGEGIALGSGFFIDSEGTAVTNYHVMEGAYSAEAELTSGVKASVLGVIAYSEELDLAIIKVDTTDTPFLTLSEDGVETGQTVYAIGSSLGLTGTFSNGIVSAASREIEGIECIQVTAPISSGNSGGPLVNEYCEVVGVNSMTVTEGQNLNFAINITELKKLDMGGFTDIEEFGEATAPLPGFYGVYSNKEIEPNGTKGSADTLYSNTPRAADISGVNDEDYYKFSVSGSCTVKIYFRFSDSDTQNASFRFGYYNGSSFKNVDLDFDYYASEDVFIATLNVSTAREFYFIIMSPSNPYGYNYPIYYAVEIEIRY